MFDLEKLIIKYRASLEGEDMVRIWGKPTKKEMEFLKRNKPEIIKILKEKKAEEERKKLEEKRRREEERESLIEGKIPLEISYHDGEYLQGYQAFGESAYLLSKLGLAEYVSGWGYHVRNDLIKTLGEKITYPQAKAYIEPEIRRKQEEKERREKEERERIERLIEKAKELGEPVEVERHVVDCDGSVPECSTDILIRYVNENGEFFTKRIHTH